MTGDAVPRRATVRDVAELAGVSPGTVSKALNRTGQISDATRGRIVEAAEKLDFRVNELARSVFAKRSFTVGVITTDGFERFSAPVMLGAEDALGAGRISVFLCDSRDDRIRERHYIDQLLGRRVDGIIVTGRSSNERPRIEVPAGTPVVYALTPSDSPDDCSVVVDDEMSGRLAGEHLIATGRRRIAHITGPLRFDAAGRRAAGLLASLEAAGMQLTGEVLHGEWTEAWGRQAATMLLQSHAEVDAIHCGSDLIARGVADVLRDRQVRVPEDVALTGTDNWELIAEATRPPLTSVDMELEEIGRIAAQRLLEAIEGSPSRGVERVPARLVVRRSTDTTSY